MPYYGKNILGRYIKCTDSNALYDEILSKCVDDKELPHIRMFNISEAVTMLKEVSNVSSIYTFHLTDSKPINKASTYSKTVSNKKTHKNKEEDTDNCEVEDTDNCEVEDTDNCEVEDVDNYEVEDTDNCEVDDTDNCEVEDTDNEDEVE